MSRTIQRPGWQLQPPGRCDRGQEPLADQLPHTTSLPLTSLPQKPRYVLQGKGTTARQPLFATEQPQRSLVR